MKSAKAARRSSDASGSSTSGMSRVNGSSSTTMTGGAGTVSGLLRLDVDPERGEHAVVHEIGADQHGQLDDLAFVIMLADGVEDIVRHLGAGDHRIDVGERRALGLVEEFRR